MKIQDGGHNHVEFHWQFTSVVVGMSVVSCRSLCVCACVRACVRACIRACVRAYVHVCVCRGLYVTINDIDHVYEILCNWPETDVKVTRLTTVVTVH